MAHPVTVSRPAPFARSSVWLLAALIGLCLAVGYIGNLVTREEMAAWYPFINKPAWTPPSWVFGPIWTMLYVLMGVAGWRVASSSAPAHVAWGVWWAQLIVNAVWSPIFFGAHAVGAAVIVILVLWAAIVWFIRLTWPLDRAASWLFVPYLAWVSYATTVNIGVWMLN